jgi:hypothetical protein
LTIGENTNIGRREHQPFELIERIEPFEHVKPPKSFVRVENIQPLQTSQTTLTIGENTNIGRRKSPTF